MRNALCVGSAPNKREDPSARDFFFPEKGESYNEAVGICIRCPVIMECRQYRDKTGSKHGMWGAQKGIGDAEE